jgi:hypothetical protein
MSAVFFTGFSGINRETVLLRAVASTGIGDLQLPPFDEEFTRGLGGGWRCSYSMMRFAAPTSASSVFCGFGFRSDGPQNARICDFQGADLSSHCSVHINGSIVEVRASDGTTVLAASEAIDSEEWVFVEVGVTLSNSGSVTIRLDDVVVDSGTGDTLSATASTLAFIELGDATTIPGLGCAFADFYINDDTGAAPNNTFWGDTAILGASVGPTIDSETGDISTDFIPSQPFFIGNNWRMLEGEISDGEISFNSSNTAGDRDMFNMTPPFGLFGDVMRAIAVRVVARSSDGSAQSVSPVFEYNSVTTVGTPQALGLGYSETSMYLDLDPSTGLPFTGTQYVGGGVGSLFVVGYENPPV